MAEVFFLTLMSLLTFLLMTQTFSFRYLEIYDIPSRMIKTLRYETVLYIYIYIYIAYRLFSLLEFDCL